MYILFSIKYGGFISQQSNYVSTWQDARRYTEEAMLAVCAANKTATGYGVLPISLELLESI